MDQGGPPVVHGAAAGHGCRRAAAVLLGLLAWPAAAHAAEHAAEHAAGADPSLYTCRVIVTGTDRRDRRDGLTRCLTRMVVKLTGDPGAADDPRVAALAARPEPLVEDILYLDRESDEAHRDEQGSRDRPFDLLAAADPRLMDRALAAAGRHVWAGPRPTLLALVSVTAADGTRFAMAGDGEDGERQRQALVAAGGRFGLRVALPVIADLTPGHGPAGLAPGSRAAGMAARPDVAVLTGTLQWSDADHGWNGRWRLGGGKAGQSWSIRGVSFDDAFRDAVGGAAKRLSAGR